MAGSLIAFAICMIMFYFVLHFSLVYHGKSAIASAAQDGLAAAQLRDGTEADGLAAMHQTLQLATGVQILGSPSVSIDGSNSQVTVKVAGRVDTVMVGVFDEFQIELVGPKERFYSEAERP